MSWTELVTTLASQLIQGKVLVLAHLT